MLVLSRQRDQTVMLGDSIQIVLLAIEPARVVLVIYAPPALFPQTRNPPHRALVYLQRGESVRIGEEIVVSLVDIRDDKVRLGVWAPPELSVRRKEVYEAIRREQERDRES